MEKDKNTLRIKQKENSREGFDEKLREKLINNTGELNQMENKLIDIERQGEETNQIMQGANADLRGQRDVLISVQDKNNNIDNKLKQGAKVISQISLNEYKQRFILYLTILVLFATDIFLVVFIITRKFGSK